MFKNTKRNKNKNNLVPLKIKINNKRSKTKFNIAKDANVI